jgi:formate C-acetyltransferase
MANWAGYDEMHSYIMSECKHYGNGYRECDEHVTFAAQCIEDSVNNLTGPRGKFCAGLYPVATNVMFGNVTKATPDGLKDLIRRTELVL